VSRRATFPLLSLQNVIGSRLLASSSQSTSFFHTSAFLHAETSRKAVARAVKKSNNVRKAERWRKAQASRPSVVLGTRPGDDEKWKNSDLGKILVDEEALVSNTDLDPTQMAVGIVHMPKQMGFGVEEAEKRLLFGDLPTLSAMAAGLREASPDMEKQAEQFAVENERELRKANAFAQLLDLRNANAAGIAYENRRRIITAFSTPLNPFDTGRSEVQGMPIFPCIASMYVA
jgi:small subunit ribosomal protein S15